MPREPEHSMLKGRAMCLFTKPPASCCKLPEWKLSWREASMEIGFTLERLSKNKLSSASEDTVILLTQNALLVFGKGLLQKKTMFINKARALSFLTASLTGKAAFANSQRRWLGAPLAATFHLCLSPAHSPMGAEGASSALGHDPTMLGHNNVLLSLVTESSRWKTAVSEFKRDSVPCTQQLLESLSPGKRVLPGVGHPFVPQPPGALCSLSSSGGAGAVWVSSAWGGSRMRPPNLRARAGRSPAASPAAQPCQGAATLAPSQWKSTARSSAMRGLCAGERIFLADTTLDWVTEPFPVFSQVHKGHKGCKAF